MTSAPRYANVVEDSALRDHIDGCDEPVHWLMRHLEESGFVIVRENRAQSHDEAQVERVARAMAEQDALGATADGPGAQRQSWLAYVRMALAAIEAMHDSRAAHDNALLTDIAAAIEPARPGLHLSEPVQPIDYPQVSEIRADGSLVIGHRDDRSGRDPDPTDTQAAQGFPAKG